jgi:hypothetical protein
LRDASFYALWRYVASAAIPKWGAISELGDYLR